MSPGSPGEGPRRIDWGRLPGPGGAQPPPPAAPRAPGRLPRGPEAGTRPIRRPEGPTGPRERVTGPHDRVAAERERVHRSDEPEERKETESRLSQPHKRQYLSLWVELPLLLVVAFSAAVLLRTFAIQPFYIPSGSMEQTLQEGDKVLVLKLTTTLRSPQRGEVIVFRGTDSWDPEYRPKGGNDSFVGDVTTGVLDLIGLAEPDEKDFIKRVIAVGGDTVACCDDEGRVTVNGVSLDESAYVYDDAPLDVPPGSCHSRLFDEVTVAAGEVWVMGDHRGNSRDSRCQGPVPVENIIGRAIALVWPTDRATELEIPAAFEVLDPPETSADTAAAGETAPDAHAWHSPPALPATAIPPVSSQATARRAPLGAERERVDSHRDRRRASARRRR
ncbi:signal peptidase I [Glycomyces sp. NPDC046736]|uniref:signal peptidase I n=1 Tax=Glycomyces sp. NPDC046736 TaxID=3155615 RepID=UPI00340BBCC7